MLVVAPELLASTLDCGLLLLAKDRDSDGRAARAVESNLHRLLVELFTETNALSDLLRITRGVRLGKLRTHREDVSRSKPVLRRGDGFFFIGPAASPHRWLFLEVQTSVSLKKVKNLPVSFEMARARYPKLKGDVVIITVGADVARFFDTHPFRVDGPLGTTRILHVVRIDLSTKHAERLLDPRRPYLGVLAVAATREAKEALEVAERAIEIAKRVGGSLGNALADDILAAANEAVRRKLEEKMQRQGFRSPFLRKLVRTEVSKAKRQAKAQGREEGKALGAAESLRGSLDKILRFRSIAVTDELRRRIDSETEITRLDRWVDRALTASTASEIFADA